MSQELEPKGFEAEVDFGARLRQALQERPDLDVQQMLNVASDLMGERDSLLPALRVLATQPSLLALLRAAGTPAARPQFDAVIGFASQTLAPAMVSRLQHALAAASGLTFLSDQPASAPLPVSFKTSSPSSSAVSSESQGTLVAASIRPAAAEPGTMVATDLRPAAGSQSPPPAPSLPVGSPGLANSLQVLIRPVVFLIIVLFGFYGLLRSPWLCESFDLCNTQSEPPKKPAQPPDRPATQSGSQPARPQPSRAVVPSPVHQTAPESRAVTRPAPLPAPKPDQIAPPPSSSQALSEPAQPLW